ncbi:hypothetical protein FHL15_005008 [Xylaria flabelliformis]|uniref:Uncharacterized protein n=1 Tax=Xylaria flabelliformis TaxID=2512241 RepID=A0A553I208_9PEZI|nr:hypothetical protein FHL15_005008 [Xylaria flabelliformis]
MMAAQEDRPYRHRGVYIPFADAEYVDQQWSSDDNIQKDGFIFIDGNGHRLSIVQSVCTGDIFLNKVLIPETEGLKKLDGRVVPEEVVTADLRMSTAPNVEGPLIGPLEVRGKMRTYFSEVALWQNMGHNAYSIYFKFYNGGSLAVLHERYNNELLPVPESFSTFTEELDLVPTTSPENGGSEPTSRMGFEENAFPELVLGDFGHGGIHGDREDTILGGRWNSDELEEWHDTYAIFNVVKELCMAHIHYDHHNGDAPEAIDCDEINGFMTPEHAPYSDDLFNVLRRWEYPNCKNSSIDETQENDEEVVPNATLVPDLDEIVNDILPIARSHVQRFRVPRADLRLDYYRSIDVSWTKPRRLMPYRWMRLKSDPDEDEDEDDDSQQDDQNNGGGGAELQTGSAGGSGTADHQRAQDSSIHKNDKSSAIALDGNLQGNENHGGDPMEANQSNGVNDDAAIGDDIYGEGGPDQDNGDEDNGDEDGQRINIEEESTDIMDSHKCPEPSPRTNRDKLKELILLERQYPNCRPPHRVVMLHYRRPVMLNPKYPPNQPLRGIPPSPTPTASSSLSVLETPSTPTPTASTPPTQAHRTTAAPEGGREGEEDEEEEREAGEVLMIIEEEAAQDKAEVLLRLEDSRHEDVTSEGSTHSNDRIRNFEFLEPPL